MNKEEKIKIQQTINEKGQNAVNEIVNKEKNRISKLKDRVNEKNNIKVKKYLIDTPNPNQKNIDKLVESEKEKQQEKEER